VIARNTDYWRAILGGTIIVLVLLFPQGLAGFAGSVVERIRGRRAS
jgi:branched-chain amino acid transport system permease protein